LQQDIRDTARLMDALDHVHAVSPLVTCSDVPPALVSIISLKEMIENTLKPVYLNRISSAEEAKFFIRMGVIISAGVEEFRKNPWPYPRVSPISPLRFEKNITEAIRECALMGLPIGIMPVPISGASSPMTLAGTLVLQNAEVLTGLTIIQVLNPGCPVIYGARASVLDMRTAFTSWGSPEVGIMGACAVQLAQQYNLPSDVYGLSTNAKLPDAQAGYEKAVNGILPVLTGANFISGMGMLGGNTSSYEQLVIDNEIFEMSFPTLRSPIFTLDDITLGLDVIEEVVNSEGKSHFLAQPHTREFFRKGEHLMPNYRVTERNSTEEWLKLGGKDIAERARDVAKEILAEHEPEPLDKDIREGLDSIVKQAYEEFLG
jgi:trimethylamine--corrinoid protein Co-methyltransferase